MSARFAAMKEGDTILLDKTATGFLLPERFPDGKDLVMLCTGSEALRLFSLLLSSLKFGSVSTVWFWRIPSLTPTS